MQVGPGQITDDSEMAMCIMQGLTDPEAQASSQSTLNLDGITYYFGIWKDEAFGKDYSIILQTLAKQP